MNNVTFLKHNSFSQLAIEDKIKIKTLGRPTPDLTLIQKIMVKNKEQVRKFNRNMYSRNSWICGCEKLNLFFCFPCILFNRNDEKPWSQNGIGDLSHLSQKIKKHEESKSHKHAFINLSLLGKSPQISEQLSEDYRKKMKYHTRKVKKNRYILSKIIDCIKFCGKFELALRGHDESIESLNPGVFKGLINFSSELDQILKKHLKSSTVFKGTSKDIQNDILDCMLEVCQENIKKEIESANFISVIADETTDITNRFQLVTIIRYTKQNGKPVERFWSFLNPERDDAVSISSSIKTVLNDLIGNEKKKLISQSYDGANVMCGQYSDVQALIRKDYENAHFVHCYAHQLNLIMLQAASVITEVKIFFATISEITSFFGHSSQRIKFLDEIVDRRLPSTCTTKWNFHSISVVTIHENRDSLIECFEKISEESKQVITVNQAQGLKLKLENKTFNFWLNFFFLVMPHVNILYYQIQSRNITPTEAKKAVESFKNEILNIRDTVHSIHIDDEEMEEKRPKRVKKDNYISKTIAAKEVCDIIINQASVRFQFNGHLALAKIFDFEKFKQFKKEIPTEEIATICQYYPFLLENELTTELKILYERDDFRNAKKTTTLLGVLVENNLEVCFPQLIQALNINVTIPISYTEAERSFSCLKRIKTFLRSTMNEEKLTALAMLSLEKEFIEDINNFNDQVIKKFTSKKK